MIWNRQNLIGPSVILNTIKDYKHNLRSTGKSLIFIMIRNINRFLRIPESIATSLIKTHNNYWIMNKYYLMKCSVGDRFEVGLHLLKDKVMDIDDSKY